MLAPPLPRWGKRLSRAPIVLYQLGLGRLLGHRFLVVVHRGRRSGRIYRTMLEVARWDGARREATVAAGRGERASWWRNVTASPAVEVWWEAERFVPEQRVLELSERIEVLRGYTRAHPVAARIVGPLLGVRPGREEEAAARLPMIAFRAHGQTGS